MKIVTVFKSRHGRVIALEQIIARRKFRIGIYLCNLFHLNPYYPHFWAWAVHRHADDITLRLLWFAIGWQKLVISEGSK